MGLFVSGTAPESAYVPAAQAAMQVQTAMGAAGQTTTFNKKGEKMNDLSSALWVLVPVFVIVLGFIIYGLSQDIKTTHGLECLKTEVDMLSAIGPVAATYFQLTAGSVEYTLLSIAWFLVARVLARQISKLIAALEEVEKAGE